MSHATDLAAFPIRRCCHTYLPVISAIVCFLSCLPLVSSEQVLKSFSKLCPSSSLVNRDGETLEVDSTTLVMGDVVILK